MCAFRKYFGVVLLFWMVGIQAVGSGCLAKVERACGEDADCRPLFPKIYCYQGFCSATNCEPGNSKSCYEGPKGTEGKGICRKGRSYCQSNGTWGPCEGQRTPGLEICDRVDNDCDGHINEKSDKDLSDAWCKCKTPGARRQCYSGPKDTLGKGECTAGIQYCERDFYWGECRGQVLASSEICDGKDNDCNGHVDDGDRCVCQPGSTQGCYNGPSHHLGKGEDSICSLGTQTCKDDKHWGPCENQVLAKDKDECGNGKDDDCDGQIDNGCPLSCKRSPQTPTPCDGQCVDLKSNPEHCGKCKNAVAAGHQCCDGVPQNTQLDPAHCGGCSQACKGGQVCLAGECKDQCAGNYPDFCGGRCTQVSSDPQHCGKCDKACQKGEVCVNGSCANRCSGNYPDFCEDNCVDTRSDRKHCGECGRACKDSEICQAGACKIPCPQDAPALCQGRCVNFKTDAKHCGGCQKACKDSEICKDGSCTDRCTGSSPTFCGGSCVNTDLDPRHCGACNNKCAANQYCTRDATAQKGVCRSFCVKPFNTTCNNICVNTQSDINNCGDCGIRCKSNQFCDGASCVACLPAMTKCGSSCCTQGQSCCGSLCVDLQGHPDHCGGCNVACQKGQVCQQGKCSCINGTTQPCYTGKAGTRGVGQCKDGLQTCQSGQWGACTGQTGPTTEDCNGKDDDCDGQIDNGTLTGKDCPQVGICAGHKETCKQGSWVCEPPGYSPIEKCNLQDDDCDGLIDEDVPTSQKLCSNQKGVCAGATMRCIYGTWVDCTDIGYRPLPPNYEPVETRCDGKDNDCDGQIDPLLVCPECIPSHQTPLVTDYFYIKGYFQRMAIHPNGRWYAWTQYPDKTKKQTQVQFWNDKGFVNIVVPGYADPRLARAGLAFSNDGSRLIAGLGDTVSVWDILKATPAKLGQFRVSGNIQHLALNSKSEAIAAAVGKTVELWNYLSLSKVATLAGHAGVVNGIDFHPNGNWLASAGQGRRAIVWNIQTGKQVHQFTATDEARSVRFSKDGKLLAVGTGRRSSPIEPAIYLLETSSWTTAAKLSNKVADYKDLSHFASVESLDFSSRSTLLYSAGGFPEYAIRVWDVSVPTKPFLRRTLTGPYGAFVDVIASSDSKTLFGSEAISLRKWSCDLQCDFSNAGNVTVSTTAAHPLSPITALSFSPDEYDHVITGSTDKSAKFWEGSGYSTLKQKLGLAQYPLPGTVVTVGVPFYYHTLWFHIASGKEISFWKVAGPPRSYPPKAAALSGGNQVKYAFSDDILATALHPGNNPIAVATGGKTVEILNTFTATPNVTKKLSLAGLARHLAFSSSGKHLAAGYDNKLSIWDTRDYNKAPVVVTAASAGSLTALAFHPNDPRFFAVAVGNKISVWSFDGSAATQGYIMPATNGHSGDVAALTFSPNGQRLLTGGKDGKLKVWAWRTKTYLYDLPNGPTTEEITKVAWRSDGKLIAAGTNQGTLYTWNHNKCP